MYIFGRARASKFACRLWDPRWRAAPTQPNSSGSPIWRSTGGTRGAAGAAAQAQPGPARLHPRSHLPAPRARSPARAAAGRPVGGRRRLRRRPLCEPLAASALRSPGSIWRRPASRRRPATRAPPDSRSTTGWRPPRSWLPSAAGSTWSAPWRWSSTSPTRRVFSRTCAALVRPGGGLVLATLNRTFRAFALGIVAAEYVLGWLPRGTHSWSRFVRPSEAARPLRRAGLRIEDLSGVVYDPLRDRFRLSRDLAVNYMLFATRGSAGPDASAPVGASWPGGPAAHPEPEVALIDHAVIVDIEVGGQPRVVRPLAGLGILDRLRQFVFRGARLRPGCQRPLPRPAAPAGRQCRSRTACRVGLVSPDTRAVAEPFGEFDHGRVRSP